MNFSSGSDGDWINAFRQAHKNTRKREDETNMTAQGISLFSVHFLFGLEIRFDSPQETANRKTDNM